MSHEIRPTVRVVLGEPVVIASQLAQAQRREIVLRHTLHLLNRAHRRSKAALCRQAEAAQALRERVFALERHALVGNMGQLTASTIRFAEDLRRPRKPKPIDVKDDRLWIDAQGGIHTAPSVSHWAGSPAPSASTSPSAPLSCQDADEPEEWVP